MHKEAYGTIDYSDQPVRLSELALALSPEAMRSFASFVAFAAQEMERMGPAYDHVHWQDHVSWQEGWPDVQLTRIYARGR